MTVVTGEFFGAGVAHGRALLLNPSGIPMATGASGAVYQGLEIATLKNFNHEIPEYRRIDHRDGMRVVATDFLPPIATGKATMASGSINPATLAALSGINVVNLGDFAVVGQGTSKQGYEPDVCVYAVQPQVNNQNSRRWKMTIAPCARVALKDASMNENEAEYGVDVLLGVCSKYPWGISFASGVEGFTKAQVVTLFSEKFPVFCTWLGDNTVTKFLFPTAYQAYSTAKIAAAWVWVSSTGISAIDATVTKATDGITPTAKPAAGDIVMCLYESASEPA